MERLEKEGETTYRSNGRHHQSASKPWTLPAESLHDLARALEKQSKRFRKELKRCQKKFTTKSVHSSRVASRRLLSTVELLGFLLSADNVQKFHRYLKAHLSSFNELRDTQVQLRNLRTFGRFSAARPFKNYLLKREKRFAKRARKAINQVRYKKLEKLINTCRQQIDLDGPATAQDAASRGLIATIEDAFELTVELRARIIPRVTQTIHETRVAFKKFRYMMEALDKYLPGRKQKLLEDLHKYQDMMGEIQDAVVLLEVFDEFILCETVDGDAAFRMRENLMRRRRELIRVYLANADLLLGFWPVKAETDNQKLKSPLAGRARPLHSK